MNGDNIQVIGDTRQFLITRKEVNRVQLNHFPSLEMTKYSGKCINLGELSKHKSARKGNLHSSTSSKYQANGGCQHSPLSPEQKQPAAGINSEALTTSLLQSLHHHSGVRAPSTQ